MAENQKPTDNNAIVQDHREIGKKLNLFTFDDLIGSGFPIWLEKGNTLKQIIVDYINKLQKKFGIKLVKTPVIAKKELYEISGHLDHYKENIFPFINIEDKEYCLRPMTCPHHILLLKKQILTHKSFPVAYGENAMLYRYEYSGGLLGLERVRAMELIDTHIFLMKTQIDEEIIKACELIFYVISVFNIQLSSINLSVRDPNNKEKFFQDDELWKYTEDKLDSLMKKFLKTKPEFEHLYIKDIGGAAFYGPKIDFQIKTQNQKEITLSTIQLDFLLPQKFEIIYKDHHQKEKTPIIIHLGIIGTLERFISYLLERYSGNLPIWLAPVQVVVIPINNNDHVETCEKLKKILMESNVRAEVDAGDNNFNKKIKLAQQQKIPYQIVVGNKEAQSLEQITYKQYGTNQNVTLELSEFINLILNNYPQI